MKHKVKVIEARNNVITLRIDGDTKFYIISRPEPLSAADSKMIRNVMDTRIMEALVNVTKPGTFPTTVGQWIAKLFSQVWAPRKIDIHFDSTKVADYILRNAVVIDIDKKTKVFAISEYDLNKIREGDV